MVSKYRWLLLFLVFGFFSLTQPIEVSASSVWAVDEGKIIKTFLSLLGKATGVDQDSVFSLAKNQNEARNSGVIPLDKDVIDVFVSLTNGIPSNISKAIVKKGQEVLASNIGIYKLILVGANDTQLSVSYIKDYEIVIEKEENGNFVPQEPKDYPKSAHLRIPFKDGAFKIILEGPDGKIDESMITVSPGDNLSKPNTHTIEGIDIQRKRLQQGNLLNKFSIDVSAQSNPPLVDFVFVSENFNIDQMADYHNSVNNYINVLLSYEPFRSRVNQFVFHVIDNTTDIGCDSPFSCQPDSIDRVAGVIYNSGLPVDTAALIINSTSGGGTASGVPIEVSLTGKSSPHTFVHEFSHSFGELRDEYVYNSSTGGTITNKVNLNCYQGSPPAIEWQDVVALKNYTQGCSHSNYYRSHPYSLMTGTGTHYYNAVSQRLINQKIDRVAGSHLDDQAPTVAISNLKNSQTISGIVNVDVTTSDNLGVGWVDLTIDNVLHDSDFASPFSFSVDTTKLSYGTHEFKARSFDAKGLYSTNSISLVVGDPSNPTMAPSTPTPTSTSVEKPGDANRDGLVNDLDFRIWYANIDKSVTDGATSGDFNGSGIVDGVDYMIWYTQYGK